MNNKKTKFFEDVKQMTEICMNASFVLSEVFKGIKTEEEGLSILSDGKKEFRNLYIPLNVKMNKAFKDPEEFLPAQDVVYRLHKVIGSLKETMNRLSISMKNPPDELESMIVLMTESLSEWKKIMNYTDDVEKNLMKMEARCRKIYAYEEKGDELFREAYRMIFRKGNDPLETLYWKEILETVEELLDTLAGMVPPFQKIVIPKE